MNTSDEYRQLGEGALKLAAAAADPEMKARFVRLAEAWLRLATFAERNEKSSGDR